VRVHVKRFGRNMVVVLPRIGRWKPQITVYLLPRSFLLGVSWFTNDDDEQEAHFGVGLVVAEVTFWTWTPTEHVADEAATYLRASDEIAAPPSRLAEQG
jgi:hypothetical protein